MTIAKVKATDMSASVGDFCEQLAAALVSRHRRDLPLDSGDMAAAMYAIALGIRRAARKAFDTGNRALGDDLLEILDEIGPNPNTGSYDFFWSNLRQLQPSKASVDNPHYYDLKLKQAAAAGSADEPQDTSPIWRDLIEESANQIIQRL